MATAPDLRDAFTRNRAAIEAAETNEQILARLYRQRATECTIRVRGAMAQHENPMDAWDAGDAEMKAVYREYAPLIAKYAPPVPEYRPTSDPVFQGGNASLRYWGRV